MENTPKKSSGKKRLNDAPVERKYLFGVKTLFFFNTSLFMRRLIPLSALGPLSTW